MRITSPKKAAAARRNGRLSRGPITPQGKRRSSRNALRHGFRSSTHLPAFVPHLFHFAASTVLNHLLTPNPFFNALLVNLLFWRAWFHRNNFQFDQIPLSDTRRLVLNLHEALLVYPHYARALFAFRDYVRLHGLPEGFSAARLAALPPFPLRLPHAAAEISSPANEPITPLESTKPLTMAVAAGAAPAPAAPAPQPENRPPANKPITASLSTKPPFDPPPFDPAWFFAFFRRPPQPPRARACRPARAPRRPCSLREFLKRCRRPPSNRPPGPRFAPDFS